MLKGKKLSNKRHHSNYVSNQDVIHKCLTTYYGELFQNMPFVWYVDRVQESTVRKGFNIPRIEIAQTVRHFLQQKDGFDICPHCLNGIIKEK